MASVNRLVLIGNLGADPEMRALPSGDSVAKLNLATIDRRSDGKGGYAEATEWHRIALYGKQAEVARQYLRKGSQVYVEGRLRSSVWTDREGVARKTWSVIADRMQMLGKPEVRDANAGPRDDPPNWIDSAPPNDPTRGGGAPSTSTTEDDDIPF